MTYFCFIESDILTVPHMEPLSADTSEDAVNEALAMRTGQGLVLATGAVERYVVDGAVEGTAAGTGAVGRLTRRTESGYVRSYAGYMLAGTVLVLIAVLAAIGMVKHMKSREAA